MTASQTRSARQGEEVMEDSTWREEALAWVGRRVRIVEGPSTEHGVKEVGTVLCVDATDYRPSAWVKVADGSSYPSYRSCDLCWLEDADTEEGGPVWCMAPDADGHGVSDAAVIPERIAALAASSGDGGVVEAATKLLKAADDLAAIADNGTPAPVLADEREALRSALASIQGKQASAAALRARSAGDGE